MEKSTGTQPGDSPPPQYSPPQGPYAIYAQPEQQMYGQTLAPPAYEQQAPTAYRQQQPTVIQQPYNQASYAAQGQTVIVVSQSRPPKAANRTDWATPKSKLPGILTLIVAVLNLIAFIGIGVTSVFYAEFCIAFVLYLVVGVLGVVAAQQQRSNGIAISCIVMACISLVMAFAQIIQRGLSIGYGQMLAAYGGIAGEGQVVIWVNVAILFVSLLAFGLSIALIVIPSKILCCSRNTQQTQESVGMTPNQVAFTAPTQVVMAPPTQVVVAR